MTHRAQAANKRPEASVQNVGAYVSILHQVMHTSERVGTRCTCFETVLREQKHRILAALAEARALDASPIIQNDECLSWEEYTTLVYELHHVHLPELQSQGLIEFDRRNDQVTRGSRFDEICSLPHDDVSLN